MPTRAVYWPRARTLFIADTHWGKSAAIRRSGIPFPAGTTADDLARLTDSIRRTGARRVVVLGDLLHSHAGTQPDLTKRIGAWRAGHADIAMLLIRGNHDRRAGDPPADWGMEMADEPQREPPFVLRHTPQPSDQGYVLAGHLHPLVQLQGRGAQRLRLPCFLFAPTVGTLPAFSSLARGAMIQPSPADRVYVIGDGTVIEVPARPRGQT